MIPPHAYIPGQTPRHDDALFEPLHASVLPGMTADQLCQTAAWQAGLRYLETGFFWEAHEALEPVWMQTQPNSVERHLVQALIQLANAALKERMQRPRAVIRLCDLASAHVQACGTTQTTVMSVRLGQIDERLTALRERAGY